MINHHDSPIQVENGYLNDAKRHLLRIEMDDDLTRAAGSIRELGVLGWFGGPPIQMVLGAHPLYERFLQWIQKRTDHDHALDEAILELAVVVAHRSRPNQDRMRKMGWIEALVDLTNHRRAKMVRDLDIAHRGRSYRRATVTAGDECALVRRRMSLSLCAEEAGDNLLAIHVDRQHLKSVLALKDAKDSG